jgi:hypothetical protein
MGKEGGRKRKERERGGEGEGGEESRGVERGGEEDCTALMIVQSKIASYLYPSRINRSRKSLRR